MTFQNKTVWITGASSGIGEALAYEFAKLGAHLVISSRNKTKLEEVKKRCDEYNVNCHIVILDLSEEQNVIKAVNEVLKKKIKIDILIHNGGISQRSYAVETPVKVDREIMETNFFGSVVITKSMLPVMIKQGGAHIVVVSSVVGKFGFPLRSAYSASKHALQGFYESLRAELASDNIPITIVSPGRIVTNISYNAVTHDGTKHGIMDEGQAQGMSVEICARKIIRSIRKNKKDVLIGNKEVLMVYIRKFLPGFFHKLAKKVKPT